MSNELTLLLVATGGGIITKGLDLGIAWIQNRRQKEKPPKKEEGCDQDDYQALCQEVADLKTEVRTSNRGFTDSITNISNKLAELAAFIKELNQILVKGNGKDGLVTRVAILESIINMRDKS